MLTTYPAATSVSKSILRLSKTSGLSAAAALAFSIASLSCRDPVNQNARDALGPEVDGVKPGPNHRPGQPCLLCHDGSEAPEFSVAGTVYLTPDGKTPLLNAKVFIQDSQDQVFVAGTNCVGNFYVKPKSFAPAYPFRVWISYEGTEVDMESKVHREGSCGSCHTPKPGKASAGPIFLTDLPNPPEVPVCQ